MHDEAQAGKNAERAVGEDRETNNGDTADNTGALTVCDRIRSE